MKTAVSIPDPFTDLNPVISIWLLNKDLLADDSEFYHHFQWYDSENKVVLSPHGSIHVLELNKWKFVEEKLPNDQWYYFFKEGKNWTELPEIINTPEMRQAMQVLERFSERERDYHLYQSRQNALRVQRSNQILLEEALQKEKEALHKEKAALKQREEERKLKEEALQREQVALQKEQVALQHVEEALKQKENAEKEQERLRQLLIQSEIELDA